MIVQFLIKHIYQFHVFKDIFKVWICRGITDIELIREPGDKVHLQVFWYKLSSDNTYEPDVL